MQKTKNIIDSFAQFRSVLELQTVPKLMQSGLIDEGRVLVCHVLHCFTLLFSGF